MKTTLIAISAALLLAASGAPSVAVECVSVPDTAETGHVRNGERKIVCLNDEITGSIEKLQMQTRINTLDSTIRRLELQQRFNTLPDLPSF